MLQYLFICTLLFTLFYIYIKKNIDCLYFYPAPPRNIEKFNNKNPQYQCINIDDHYALIKNGTKNKALIMCHGNAGSFLDRNYMIDKMNKYNGDIYLIEYPGFTGLKGKTNIENCVNELYFWINHLKKKYSKIDLYGESIGGGIIAETCYKYNIKINKIYLQSTFTSIKDVVKNINQYLFLFYKLFMLDDLNTHSKLKYILCNKYIIIHSKDDKLINYKQAEKNYKLLKKLGKKTKLIQGYGDHNNTYFEL